MVSLGQLVPLRIEKPAAGGRMIARANGQIVFVAGAIPGELVTARIARIAKGAVYADTVEVREPSPDRRPAFTDPACGGTAYAHIQYERQLAIKGDVVADGLMRIGRVALPAPIRVAGSRADGYRMRARLHVQPGRIGFFREGTHQLCDPRDTQQLLPATCDVLEQIATRLRQLRVDGVRQVEVAENADASSRAVHLDSAAPLAAAQLTGFDQITGLTGATLEVPGGSGRSAVTHPVAGDPYVVDRVALDTRVITLRRHVRSFFQGNRYLIRDLVAHVAAQVPAGQRVVDLYAGVGFFAVALAVSRDASVVAVEHDPYAARDLDVNAAAAGGVDVLHQPVEAFLERRRPAPDTVVLDPPRTGLSPDAVNGLLALSAPRLVYVSCDVATMGRDVRKLVESGYRVARVNAFDLFPNTPHVETVMVLTRGVIAAPIRSEPRP
jgi:23S rRNA (uracil1939-C5)-methyltransferase